jgi:hypothetical protein
MIAAGHPCPVTAGAGGLIDRAWCLDSMAPVIAGLPGWLTEETVTRPELLVHRDGPVEVYYTPFDWVNTGARIVLIGICPGRHQMLVAVREARRVLVKGGTVAEALEAADASASFAGRTRGNLVQMLDGIGVPGALGITTSSSLFGEHQDLADSNSMCNFTVQVNGENYRGSSPRVAEVPFLRAYLTQVLGAALDMMPDALVVPLGKAVSTAVTTLLVEEGRLDPRRCLLGFPHPSGQNGHRAAAFRQQRDELTARVRAWFGTPSSRTLAPVAAAPERPTAASRLPAPAGQHVGPGQPDRRSQTAVVLPPGLYERLEGYAHRRKWPVAKAAAFFIETGLNRADPAPPPAPVLKMRRLHNQENVHAKAVYLADLLSAAGPGLRAAGLGPIRPHGHSRRIALPADLAVAAVSEIRLMASQSCTRLNLVTLSRSGNPYESEALLELLKQRYGDTLTAQLPASTQIRWHARTAADVIDFASLSLHDGGYATGDLATAATWVVTCCQAWISALSADPLSREELIPPVNTPVTR